MKNFLKAMISGDKSVSSMRIGFLYLILTASAVALVGLLMRQNLFGVASLVGSILAPVSLSKAVQSFAENRPQGGQQ